MVYAQFCLFEEGFFNIPTLPRFWGWGGIRYAIGIRDATQLQEAFQYQQSSPWSIPSQSLGTEGHSACPRANIPSPVSIRNGEYNKKQWERLGAV